MTKTFLHHHKDFPDLIRIVGNTMSIDPVLIEKDYWIMHCLHGLQQLDMQFELKGGTSLSKGFGIIDRFSEDIDIRIEPPAEMGVKTNPKHQKPAHVETRKAYYDWLVGDIQIDGIINAERDPEFDDTKYYRSGGIRLHYETKTGSLTGLKEGILLEVGFDDVSPNAPHTISSWAYDFAVNKIGIIDNRAIDVACYHAGYTFVEKLQTISTKYRRQQSDGSFPANFIRHYYDVYCLLKSTDVRDFIGSQAYTAHKVKRFSKVDNQVLAENEAFLLSDPEIRETYAKAYEQSYALYYKSQPPFDEIMAAIGGVVQIGGI